jgi:hypothetical protein
VTTEGAAGIIGLLAVVGLGYALWKRTHGDNEYDDEPSKIWYEEEWYEERWEDD